MKNFLQLCLQLGMILFVGAALIAVVNWLTGWHIGMKGAEVPGDPIAAVIFGVIAGICAALTYWIDSRAKRKPDSQN